MQFYLCYRALVRAKVDALRLEQISILEEDRQQVLTEFESYLQLASTYIQETSAKIIIMRGLSASGKSAVSQQLVDAMAMIRIRSDVERKRLFSVPLNNNEKASNKINAGIYSRQASQQTYAKLLQLTSQVIESGYSVIVDATFLNYEQREPFQQLAERLNITYIILEITAPEKVLRQRIVKRGDDISDADLAVLEYQISNWQPLHEDEKNSVISVDTGEEFKISTLVDAIDVQR